MLNVNELNVLLVLIDRVNIQGSEAEAVVSIKNKIKAIIEQVENPPLAKNSPALPVQKPKATHPKP